MRLSLLCTTNDVADLARQHQYLGTAVAAARAALPIRMQPACSLNSEMKTIQEGVPQLFVSTARWLAAQVCRLVEETHV
jgi:hypothetical protein